MAHSDAKDSAVAIVRKLRDNGHQAVLAGGCVRDMLLGRAPDDYDVATSAHPEQIVALFRRTRKVGIQFGVVIVRQGTHWIEVASFRSDRQYVNGRHPEGVTFSTPEEDAQRRDFTVNGMFFDPIEERVIDFVGGQQDLQARLIRAIGDPAARIREDRLRLLRAVRFAAKLQFAIEPATCEAVRQHASGITLVSAERIREELDAMFSDRHRGQALDMLIRNDLLQPILPEAFTDPAAAPQAVSTVAALPPDAPFELTMSVLLAGCPTRIVASACRRLACSNKSRQTVEWLVAHRHSLEDPQVLGLADLKLLLAHPTFGQLMEWTRARSRTDPRLRDTLSTIERRIADIPPHDVAPPPLLNGKDLLEGRLPRGPVYKRVLEAAYHAQLNGQITTKAEALALAQRLIAEATRT